MNPEEFVEQVPFGKSITADLLDPDSPFGGYHIEDLLTITLIGGFYRVRDEDTGAHYILQVVPEGLDRDATLEPKLKQMVNSVRPTSCESLCKPLSVFRMEGKLCVLYEGENAITLSRYVLDKGGRAGLTEDETKYIFTQMAGALQSLEKVGVHHFSVTPEFILMGAHGAVRLLGAGFFQCLDPKRFEIFVSSAIKPISGPGVNDYFSTLEVLAPEMRNRYNGDIRSDLYSLGLCMYFAIVGSKPEHEWVLPSVARQGLSEGWDVFISACLEPDPANRFPTAGDFSAALATAERFHLAKSNPGGLLGRKLDRIPLPKAITEKYSEQSQYYIRLALLGIFGMIVVALGSLSFRILYEEPELPPGPPVKEVAGAAPASLELRVSPPRAMVEFGRSGTTTILVDDGLLRVQAPRGTYRVRVDAPNFIAQNFLLELGGPTVTRTVDLLPAWARLKISGPTGAMVFLSVDGERASYLDSIPEGGVLEVQDRVLAGRYTVEVRMDGFIPAIFEDVELKASESTTLDAALRPKPSAVMVKTEPEGIPVLLDGTRLGLTPLEIPDLEANRTYGLEVGGGTYEIRRRDVRLDPGEQRVISFGRIEELTGQLLMKVRLPEGVRGEIDPGTVLVTVAERSFDSGDSFTLDLPVGVHTARIEHPDYYTEELEVIITDLEPVERTVTLRPRPARLELRLPGELAYALYEGEQTLAPSTDGYFEFSSMEAHNLRLMVRDYLTLNRVWEFRPNETVVWEPELRPIPPPDEGRDFSVPYTDLRMRWMAPGEFHFGSPISEELRIPNEDDLTKVELTRGFWIAVFEMDQTTYRRVMGSNPSRFARREFPVDSVSWNDAMAFCELLNRREQSAGRIPEGYEYRLPTEAEWEYACRAGTNTPFNFGSTADGSEANFRGRYPREYGSTEVEAGADYGTRKLGSYPANAWGLHDMHGNLREWVLDKYDDRHPGGSVRDFVNLVGARGRVYKGGGWEDFAHRSRSAARDRAGETTQSPSLGFRIALAPKVE